MKKFATILLVVVLTIAIQAVRPQTPPSEMTHPAAAQAPEKAKTDILPTTPPEAQEAPETAQSEPIPAAVAPAPAAETCRSAIAKVWPAHLQAGAITVMTNENGAEDPSAKGAVNPDAQGSQDFGCFQINNYWHPGYFSGGDWTDPVWAAQYALTIYQGRLARDGVGWTAWYAVEGILW